MVSPAAFDRRKPALVRRAQVGKVRFMARVQGRQTRLVRGQMLGQALLVATLRGAQVGHLALVMLMMFGFQLGEARLMGGLLLGKPGFVRRMGLREPNLVRGQLARHLGLMAGHPSRRARLLLVGMAPLVLGLERRDLLQVPALGPGKVLVAVRIAALVMMARRRRIRRLLNMLLVMAAGVDIGIRGLIA